MQLPILWLTVGAFAAIALIVGVVIALHTPLVFDFTSEGFNFFLSTFKFPLGILALTIPVVALLAANHRSTQTSAQLVAASSQNLFSNYYKHDEEFSKFLTDLFDEKMLNRRDYADLHAVLFPRAQEGGYEIDPDYLATIEGQIDEIAKSLNIVSGGGSVGREVGRAQVLMIDAITMLRLQNQGGTGTSIRYDGTAIMVPKTLNSYFAKIREHVLNMLAILRFDRNFQPSSSFQLLQRIDYTKVPKLETRNLSEVPKFSFVDR